MPTRAMKRRGMTAKPVRRSAVSPIMPRTQGVRPKPMMPALARRMKRMMVKTWFT